MRLYGILDSRRWVPHLVHVSLIVLTTLFLLLEGVSGPTTGFWWIRVTYSGVSQDGESASAGSNSWDLGALGACQVGERCIGGGAAPNHWKAVHGNLIFHLVMQLDSLTQSAAIIFVVIGAAETFLILFPQIQTTRTPWYTLFLPVIGFVWIFIPLITDLAVRQSILSAKDVESTHVQASFWLSTLALVSSILWLAMALLVRWYELRRVAEEERRTKVVVRGGWGASTWLKSLSPFGRVAKDEENDDVERQ